MKGEGTSGADTRNRLLEAAGEIFAQRGFRTATVREIARRAGANVAAVNYHFGDKAGLYSAVLNHYFTVAVEKYPPDLGLGAGASAEDRLRAFVRSFLLRVLDEGRPAWHGKLMAAETAQPTAALDDLVEAAMRPLAEYLTGVVRGIVGEEVGEEAVRLCCMSVIAQCVYYHHAGHVIARLYPRAVRPEKMIGRIADHIVCFSLGALRGISEEARSTSAADDATDATV